MTAANTDLLRKVTRKWVGSIGSGGVADDTVATVPLASPANLTTETAVMVTVDRVDANGVATPDKEEGIIGIVSGNNLINCLRGVEGTAQAHSAGAVVEVLWTAKNVNDIIDAILVEHTQLGKHQDITASTITASTVSASGVTASDVVATSTVKTDTISEKTANAGVTVDGVKHKDNQVYTDAINALTTNHITLTPGSSKLVKIATIDQEAFDSTTNTYRNNIIILAGKGTTSGSATPGINKDVTLGITVTEIISVVVSQAGFHASTNTWAAMVSGGQTDISAVGINPNLWSTTQFRVNLHTTQGGNLSAGYYGWTWIAVCRLD